MKPAVTSRERYFMLNPVAKRLGISYGILYSRAVKGRTRFFKFNSRRYLLDSDLICILKDLRPKQTEEVQNRIDAFIESA